jgi:hypothetical protein
MDTDDRLDYEREMQQQRAERDSEEWFVNRLEERMDAWDEYDDKN